ncbi:Nucleoporin nup84 [Saxophila tyrrhenica]|uniref:Nuclear pore complex protein n=1 Tax=Saxophila tyrrhenica TaxID=1690608 RepID=A0AAV9P988_9PEZI|nr:Nucleoporin nup84 [Saxophila tyrrhenica]
MAPITRTTSSYGGGGIAKQVHRKRPSRKEPSDETWNFSLGAGAKVNGSTRHSESQHDIATPESLPNVEEAVQPLRAMADKVGKEVETFAQTLDEFFTELPAVENRFGAVFDLVLNFRDIANDVVERLKSQYERELRQQLRQEWSEQARASGTSTMSRPFAATTSAELSARQKEQVAELRSWQQEADLWDLFRIMLNLHPFESDAEERRQEDEANLAKLAPPHRYAPEGDLWDRFVLEDKLARERNDIKQWLERTAYHQQSDLQGIMEELETKAGRGKGLWSSGWLHTREKIKGEKRIRSWPNAADSPLPQIRRSDNNDLLVTTLDPDAATRQERTLEKPDAYFERAMWIACWEMLRRGTPWHDICEWFEKRKEGWRAVAVSAAMDRTDPTLSTSAFRQVSRMASRSTLASDHEAAVFGLLGGDVKTVEKVCRTVDDHLYAHYNSALLKQFDNYLLSTCPEKAVPSQWRRSVTDDSLRDPEQAEAAIQDLILRLRKGSSTSKEASQPMKIIQSYLLADEVGSLVHTVGASIAETAALQGPEDVIFLRDRQARQDGVPLPETEVALDPQTLRIAAHMSIVHRALSPHYLEGLEGDELLEDENVLVAYIQALRAAGKRDLIPIYASKLQQGRYILVLGRYLQDITDSQEQVRVLGLLQEYELDVVAILSEQLRWVVGHSLGSEAHPQPLRMLEKIADTKMHPGQQIIVGFISEDASPEDEAMVSVLQWFQHMRGGWKPMFEALSVAMRKALVTGHLTCARMILEAFPYDQVSNRKSYEVLGRAVNFADSSAEPHDHEEALSWNLMQQQSNTYYELAQLVTALDAMSEWRSSEQEYLGRMPKPPTVPTTLKQNWFKVRTAMKPILKGILQNSTDPGEAHDLSIIRENYLPEMVIAYNTVLHAAGNLITRDSLLDSMELGVSIANGKKKDEDNGLQKVFVKAGRMRELVESLALTSKVMLILRAEGKEHKVKKERRGQDLGIWEITGA